MPPMSQLTAGSIALRAPVLATESNRLPRDLVRLALTLMLGAIMVALDMTMVNVALDTLARDFHASVATIQWVSTGFLLALAMVIPLTGWVVERFGARGPGSSRSSSSSPARCCAGWPGPQAA
jgi:MFS family permease